MARFVVTSTLSFARNIIVAENMHFLSSPLSEAAGRSRKYWSDLKAKLVKEGSQLSENIGQLKMQSSHSKFYKTDFIK